MIEKCRFLKIFLLDLIFPFAIIYLSDIMNRIKELRIERGYTQIKIQHLTGIDQSDYSKIENGKRYMSFEQCRKLAIALNTSMGYLAELTNEKKPYPKIQNK